ncbi:GspH/FimT family pseudopilin [Thalassotalea euphylliae]|uniref:GspH/FimT family pseudopilin n=1 Tax=Thalassotalea euphylliae TaxID=1655234 RepID=UPI0036436333
MKKQKGFTLIELMVGIAILGVMLTIAIPNFSHWTVKMRVDDEINSLQRLILTARNTAVNMELPVRVCPLVGNECTNSWDKELTVFIDIDADGKYNAANDEVLIRTKAAIKSGDTLTFNSASVIFRSTGRGGPAGTFTYCPADYPDKNRSIVLSSFGRTYLSSDTDNDGIDEDISGAEPSCS